MNNFRAARFEDAGNNLEQIKYHPMCRPWSRHSGDHRCSGDGSRRCQGPQLKPYITDLMFNINLFHVLAF